MFHTPAPDQVELRFPSGLKVPVAPLTDSEIALTSSTEQQGLWVNTYEKAVGIHRAKMRGEVAPANPIDAISKGGSTAGMMELLTGKQTRRFLFKPFRDPAVKDADRAKQLNELRDLLVGNMQAKRLTCASTPDEAVLKPGPGITPNHAYAVLKYDRTTDILTLWNPHGSDFKPKGPAGREHGYPRKDGIFEVPLSDMTQIFSSVSLETDQPAKNASGKK
jgi:hypothetical protein